MHGEGFSIGSESAVTLNDLGRRNSRNFAFFSTEFGRFRANDVTVVEVRPILSAAMYDLW